MSNLGSPFHAGSYAGSPVGKELTLKSSPDQVFYGRPSKCEAKPVRTSRCRCRPRLRLVLFGVNLTIMSGLLTALWYTNNRQASHAMLVQNEKSQGPCVGACDESINNLVSRLHNVIGASEEMALRKFVSEPLMILQNAALMRLPSKAEKGAMDTIMRTMFWQLSKVFLNVEGIFFKGPDSLYWEYERLSHHHGHSLTENAFTVEFDVGSVVNESHLRASCPTFCPPVEDLLPLHRTVYAVSNSTGVPLKLLERFPEDIEKQDWYGPVARAGGKVVWDGPRNWNGNVQLRVAKAVVQNGEVSFIVGADFTLDYLTKFLQSMDLGASGLIFIVDRDGRVISSWPPVGHVPLSGHSHKQPMPRWQSLKNPLLRAVMEDVDERRGGLEHVGCKEGVHFIEHGPGYLYSCKLLQSKSDDFSLKWTVVNVQPLSFYKGSFHQALERNQQEASEAQEMLAGKLHQSIVVMLFISGAFLVAEAVIIWAVAEAITQPLKYLQNDMRAVAQLEFGVMDEGMPREPSIKSAESNEVCELEEVKVVVLCSCPTPVAGVKAPRGGRLSCIQEVADIRDSFTHMAAGLRSFSRYMDPSLVRMLVQSKRQARLGVAKATVTIFFSDIANFTSLAQSLNQAVFMKVLGTYLDEMSGIIMAQNGIVGEFIGDGIMAWWNAPEDLREEHTVVALASALKQQACLKRLREQWVADGLPEVRARMGLARGQVLAGNIGSPERMKYGLVGDTVNLASRLESLCKRYQVEILIDDVASKAPGVADTFLLRPLGLVTVKGRSSVTELFELVGLRQEAAPHSVNDSEAFCNDFKVIQDLYQEGCFHEALQMLSSYVQRWPHDKPAQMLRQRCEELTASAPGPAWSPVEWLSEK